MKCQGCGHDYPSTLTRCTKCGRHTARRVRSSYSDSRLIEFPRQARTGDNPAPETVVPAWRAELSEKVKQIKAKRNSEAAAQSDSSAFHLGDGRAPDGSDSTRAGSREANPIVEAALTRVRRANQDASRGSVASVSSSGGAGAKAALSVDRKATARALEVTDEPNSFTAPRPAHAPTPRISISVQQKGPSPATSAAVSPPAVKQPAKMVGRSQSRPVQNRAEASAIAKPAPTEEPLKAEEIPGPAASSEGAVLERVAAGAVDYIDEIDPLDYLAAEVRKVDKALARELPQNTIATLFSRVVTGIVDLSVIAVSAAPFVALLAFNGLNLWDRSAEMSVAAIVVLICFFYLAFTQCSCGKTFGMMVTSTHIADAASEKPPTMARLMVRTLGIFLALAPAGLGLLWAVFNKQHRGWQDLLAGTVVVRDF
jgi:uncharacterized RDD family membrane protein YckC